MPNGGGIIMVLIRPSVSASWEVRPSVQKGWMIFFSNDKQQKSMDDK